MYRPTQQTIPGFGKSSTDFGGAHIKGKRKTARPICTKRSIHIVLRSETARGRLSLLYPVNARMTFRLLTLYSKRFHISIYRFVNVGNHIHLVVKARTKEGLRNFLRVAAGQIAQRILGTRPGVTGKFWSGIVFTRLVEWGRAFDRIMKYLGKNLRQAAPVGAFSRLKC